MEVVVNTSVCTATITEEERQAYVEFVKNKYPNKHITKLVITPVNDEEVELYSEFDSTPFQRIRRITGYLVGTLDRFNNGKRAEEHDRVKHDVRSE